MTALANAISNLHFSNLSMQLSLEIGIFVVLFAIWLKVMLMAYEFYTTTLENRFRFRYWFAIGMLNCFHISLGIFFKLSGDDSLQSVRWAAFAVIDILYLEAFIHPVKKRTTELWIRATYYAVALLQPVILSAVFPVLNALTLAFLALSGSGVLQKTQMVRTSKSFRSNIHFFISFLLYSLTTIVPVFTGFSGSISLIMGAIFSIHLAMGVTKLYHEEMVREYEKTGSKPHKRRHSRD